MTRGQMRLAVTGQTGQVARALVELGMREGMEVVPLARPVFDLAQPDTVLPALRAAGVDAVVNAAAYTAVDAAQDDAANAFAVNEGGAAAVAQAAQVLGIPVVHLSTDYVFDGSGTMPWREGDRTGPLGVYGASKLAGESAIARACANHAILRTAWVYSPFGANFVKTMLRLGADRDVLRVVQDQIGNPTSAHDIAQGVIGVARNLLSSADPTLRGTFHMAGTGAVSWAGFARETFRLAALHGQTAPQVIGIPAADYPTPAARPANSQLDCAALADVHGITLPNWRDGLAIVVGRLMESRT
ncbi:dTDP-4-dehydrorhamnose reductase [Monaibacterium marinum]|uniref:dTDP-4-dehydrorhamnose reductase n=1 Tax=Pontivivens marinum TaxID=1690039 RepID=A0A2C9CVM6_9RHOB|nr:dTDP-4-dehydrorhamnose reductase [Monaibacterium marinum]SOH95426.1 dTDP-4-dehydrorhamnose reductase [Monaibacterium marinum]